MYEAAGAFRVGYAMTLPSEDPLRKFLPHSPGTVVRSPWGYGATVDSSHGSLQEEAPPSRHSRLGGGGQEQVRLARFEVHDVLDPGPLVQALDHHSQ